MATEHYEWTNAGSLPVRGERGQVRTCTLHLRYLVHTATNGAVARLPIGFRITLEDGSELERLDDDSFRALSDGEVYRFAPDA